MKETVNVNKDQFLEYNRKYGFLHEDLPVWERQRWTLGEVYIDGEEEGHMALICHPELDCTSMAYCFIKLTDPMDVVGLLKIAGLVKESYDINCEEVISIDSMTGEVIWLAIDSCQSFNIPEDIALEMGFIKE